MKWSIRLGRYLGMDVYLHVTFLLLLGFIGLSHWLAGRPARFTVVEVANHGHGIAEYARRVGADLVVLDTMEIGRAHV